MAFWTNSQVYCIEAATRLPSKQMCQLKISIPSAKVSCACRKAGRRTCPQYCNHCHYASLQKNDQFSLEWEKHRFSSAFSVVRPNIAKWGDLPEFTQKSLSWWLRRLKWHKDKCSIVPCTTSAQNSLCVTTQACTTNVSHMVYGFCLASKV